MDIKKGILKIMILGLIPIGFSYAYADSPQERALGIGSQNNNSDYYNTTGELKEIYPGVWAKKPIKSNNNNRKEIYPGVWKFKKEKQQDIVDNQNKTSNYKIINRSTASGNKNTSRGLDITSEDNNYTNNNKSDYSNSNNKTSNRVSNGSTYSTDSERSSQSLGTVAGGGVNIRPRERTANLPTVDSLIVDD